VAPVTSPCGKGEKCCRVKDSTVVEPPAADNVGSVPFFYFNSQTKSLMPCPKG